MAKLVACHADSYAQSFQSKVVACTPVAGSEHKQKEGAASGGASSAAAAGGKKGKTDAKVRAAHCTLASTDTFTAGSYVVAVAW